MACNSERTAMKSMAVQDEADSRGQLGMHAARNAKQH